MPSGTYCRLPATRKKLSESMTRRWQNPLAREKARESHPGARQQVIAMRLKDPYATLQEIGDVAEVSRERVRKILQSEGLPTRSSRVRNMKRRLG